MDLLAIIRILVKNGQFSFDEYNEALARLEFSSYEKNDKPCQVPNTASLKVIKLKGKAIINWVHLRNWPLVVRMLIRNLDDPALALGLQLHEIVERLTAYELDVLEDRITEYLVMRAKLQMDYPTVMPKPKPKHHFLWSVFGLLNLASRTDFYFFQSLWQNGKTLWATNRLLDGTI